MMEEVQSNSIIVGRNPILEALKAGTPIEKIFILYGVRGGSIGKIRHLAKQNGIVCVDTDRQKFRELVARGPGPESAGTAQGVAALVGTKAYVDVDDILAASVERGEQPFVLVLDEIEDPQNLGALIRTAECAGAHGVIIPKHHTAPLSSAVARASAGAIELMPVAKVTNLAACLEQLKKQGIWIVGTDSDASKMFTEIDYSMPVGVVIGNEGKGIRRLVKEKCDFLVKIPLYGKIASLNASVAGALLMYEVRRRRGVSF